MMSSLRSPQPPPPPPSIAAPTPGLTGRMRARYYYPCGGLAMITDRELKELAKEILLKATDGEISLDEVALFAVRHMRDPTFKFRDSRVRKMLTDILNASIARNYDKLIEVLDRLYDEQLQS